MNAGKVQRLISLLFPYLCVHYLWQKKIHFLCVCVCFTFCRASLVKLNDVILKSEICLKSISTSKRMKNRIKLIKRV